MACTDDAKAKRRWSACLTVGVILTATLVLGTFTGSASAGDRRWEHRDDRHHGWNGGHYHAPPVIYGSPYYAPYYAPPVIYGPPGIGLNFNFR